MRHLNILLIICTFITLSCNSQTGNSQNDTTKTYKNILLTRNSDNNTIKNLNLKDTFVYIHKLAKYADTSNLRRFENEIIKFKKLDSIDNSHKNSCLNTENEILFIGSSSIRKWKTLKSDMYPIRVKNRGFGGSTIAEVIQYTKRIILPHNPQFIVLYAGENDLTIDTIKPSDVLETLKIFTEMIDFYLPKTKIYYISIKPSLARARLWQKMEVTNFLIQNYTETNSKIEYINVSDSMLDKSGEIKRDIFIRDKLHLNEKGYKIWTKIVKPYLLKLN